MQERGQFWSEGLWDVLGWPLTDGVDEVEWMAARPWSNGKVGTTGCSSTAEWQIAVVAQNNPHYAAFNAQGSAAAWGVSDRITSRATGIAAACSCSITSPGSTVTRSRSIRCSPRRRHRRI
jgi:predicted acyl esterase